MAEVTNESMDEGVKFLQVRLAQVDGRVDELKQQMLAFKTHLIGIEQESGGIHSTLVRHEQRLDRIERRLELDVTAS